MNESKVNAIITNETGTTVASEGLENFINFWVAFDRFISKKRTRANPIKDYMRTKFITLIQNIYKNKVQS